jgi:hypothetical protein
MKKSYVLKTLWVFFISIFLVYSGFLAGGASWKKNDPSFALEKTVYLETPQARSPAAVRIEIEVMDDVTKENGHVLSVEFAGKSIPLKPIDPTGRRGSTFLRLLPGEYTLEWDVQNPQNALPSENHRQKTISIRSNEVGVYLLIKGDQLFVQNENQ